jgi:hypothetical protein
MRRILFTILACTALSAAVPAMALAHNGRHHHKPHHHSRVRHEQFIGHRQASDGSAANPADTSEPTAGTVTSFDGTTLTITLNNGNTVSGAVTNDTEVKCENPAGDDDNVEHGDLARDGGPSGGDQGDQGDANDNQGDDDNNNNMCAIAPGMAVTKAELTINGSGAVWDEVELVSSSTTSTTQP